MTRPLHCPDKFWIPEKLRIRTKLLAVVRLGLTGGDSLTGAGLALAVLRRKPVSSEQQTDGNTLHLSTQENINKDST